MYMMYSHGVTAQLAKEQAARQEEQRRKWEMEAAQQQQVDEERKKRAQLDRDYLVGLQCFFPSFVRSS